jgi:peptide/nickel transport system substrate-binding protein
MGTNTRGRNLLVLLIALAGALLALVPTAGARVDAQAGPNATPTTPFVVNWALAPPTIDPAEVPSLADAGFVANFYVSLLKYGTKKGENGYPEEDPTKIEGYLATKWQASNNHRTWTLTLRRGAVLSDGSPMDARAVKYSLDRLLARGGTGASILNGNRGVGKLVDSIQAPNATTVVIRLKDSYPSYDHILTTPQATAVVNPRVVEANGGVDPRRPNTWMASHAAGGGPYILQEYDPSRRAVLLANPRFFGEKPRERRVIVNFIKSDPTLLFQQSSGRADITVGLGLQSVASLKSNSCCKVVANTFGTMVFMSLPNSRPPFDNRTFREGLTYAVPYGPIIRNVLYGYGKTYFGPFPPSYSNYNPAIGKPRGFSLAKARQLIRQSGVTLPVDLDLIIREGSTDFAQVALAVQGTWRGLGVNVSIKTLTASAYITARNTPKRDYSMIVQFGGAIADPYWTTNYEVRCGHMWNTSDYCNPAVDKLIDQAFLAPKAKKQQYWDQLARLWVRDVPRISLYTPQYVVALKRTTKHYFFGGHPLTIYKWGR